MFKGRPVLPDRLSLGPASRPASVLLPLAPLECFVFLAFLLSSRLARVSRPLGEVRSASPIRRRRTTSSLANEGHNPGDRPHLERYYCSRDPSRPPILVSQHPLTSKTNQTLENRTLAFVALSSRTRQNRVRPSVLIQPGQRPIQSRVHDLEREAGQSALACCGPSRPGPRPRASRA